MAAASNLTSTFLRLRPDSAIEKLPFDETFWPRVMSGKLGNFHHEYMVTTSSFKTDWPSWERHPMGDEIVCLLTGEVTLVLELPGGNERVHLSHLGDFALIPRGTWHTAKTSVDTTMLFITAGEGTEVVLRGPLDNEPQGRDFPCGTAGRTGWRLRFHV